MKARGIRTALAVALATLTFVGGSTGCAGVREVGALRQVEFRFDRVGDPQVAGLPLSKFTRYEDLSALDIGRLALAIAAKDVPLDLTVHLGARNPETNRTTARLLKMDWTYIVDDREIVSGHVVEEYTFPPGEPRDVPLGVRFNLVDFFGRDGKVLFETALVLAGQRTSMKRVTLRIRPTVDTSVGPIRYPIPLTIDLGAAR